MSQSTALTFRYATRDDLPAIVALLADDEKGKTREEFTDPLPNAYYAAFDAMESQSTAALPNKYLLACQGDDVVGCLQLTLIAGLSRRGQLRAQIEGVRVSSKVRGQKIGEKLIAESVDRKSTRLNSSHITTSYAVFCLKKKNIREQKHLH